MITDHSVNLQPQRGEVWRHRKHDPAAGKWHEYEIVGVSNPDAYVQGNAMVPDGVAKHTESGEILTIIRSGDAVFLMDQDRQTLEEPHVLYLATEQDTTLAVIQTWARPLARFMAGRFPKVDF